MCTARNEDLFKYIGVLPSDMQAPPTATFSLVILLLWLERLPVSCSLENPTARRETSVNSFRPLLRNASLWLVGLERVSWQDESELIRRFERVTDLSDEATSSPPARRKQTLLDAFLLFFIDLSCFSTFRLILYFCMNLKYSFWSAVINTFTNWSHNHSISLFISSHAELIKCQNDRIQLNYWSTFLFLYIVLINLILKYYLINPFLRAFWCVA